MKKLFQAILKNLKYILFIVTAITFVAKYIPIGQTSYLPIIAFIFPLTLLFLFILFIIKVFSIKNWKIVDWIMFAFFLFQGSQFVQISKSETNKNSIKVMSFNIKSLLHKKGNTRAENFNEIEAFIKDKKPDIISLQEIYWPDMKMLLPYGTNLKTTYSIASKYPVVNEGKLKIAEKKNYRNIFADLKIGNDTVRVYNLHLESYRFKQDNYEVINKIDEFILEEKPGLKTGIKSILHKIRKAYKIKASQVKLIAEHMDKCPYPIILTGDFNDISHSNAYLKLSSELSDSFIDKGKGFGGTLNSLIFPIRIDNILYDTETFRCLNHEVFRNNLSDHHAIMAKFVKTNNN